MLWWWFTVLVMLSPSLTISVNSTLVSIADWMHAMVLSSLYALYYIED